MNEQRRNLINVVATGVTVTIFLLVILFWARWFCHLGRLDRVNQEAGRVQISPMGIFGAEEQGDPNVTAPSFVTADLNGCAGWLMGLGVAQYVQSQLPGGTASRVYRWDMEPRGDQLYFDSSLKLMVYEGTSDTKDPNGRVHLRHFTCYAGPEGIAETPTEPLGRFGSPISYGHPANRQIVYDRDHKRFFAIDWMNRAVEKGPQLSDEDGHHPVQIGLLEKNPLSFSMAWRGPQWNAPHGEQGPSPSSRPAFCAWIWESNLIMVLDASGRIDLLDTTTFEFAGVAGCIPTPPTLFPFGGARPDEVGAYSVTPISAYHRGSSRARVGCIVTAASGDLTSLRLMVFNPEGRAVASKKTEAIRYAEAGYGQAAHLRSERDDLRPSLTRTVIPSPEAAYYPLPGTAAMAAVKCLLENAYPPAFLMLSYFTASAVEATAAPRSLLLLPNSFVAMKARDAKRGSLERFSTAIIFMLPAIGLAIFLSSRVARDAARLGVTKDTRLLWIIATLVLGLPAYLTYRFTQAPLTLVTCRNCGLGRRPDLEKCQQCGAPWAMPELDPPAWRVVEPEPVQGELAEKAEEIVSEGQ